MSDMRSMTGFARVENIVDDRQFAWELKAVNGRNLDIRFRLPAGFDGREAGYRAVIGKRIRRGSITAGLTLEGRVREAVPALNAAGLDACWSIIRQIHDTTGAALPDAGTLYNMRGVVDMRDTSGDVTQDDDLIAAIQTSLIQAVGALDEARAREGGTLATVLNRQFDDLERITRSIEADENRSPQALRARILSVLNDLDLPENALSADRLHQEIAILATKADLREEIDRLYAHIEAGREILAKSGPMGRQLDFLAQEFNREANTVCSKSNETSITQAGMELKLIVDQMREQVQNIE